MSCYQVVFDSNHEIFHYRNTRYRKYNLDRLFDNAREMRFKDLNDAKLMIDVLNRSGGNIKVNQKDNILHCTCKNYENCPFYLKIVDGSKTNSKSKISRIVELHDHDHYNLDEDGEKNQKSNPRDQIAKNLEGIEYQIAKLNEERLFVKRSIDMKRRKNDIKKFEKLRNSINSRIRTRESLKRQLLNYINQHYNDEEKVDEELRKMACSQEHYDSYMKAVRELNAKRIIALVMWCMESNSEKMKYLAGIDNDGTFVMRIYNNKKENKLCRFSAEDCSTAKGRAHIMNKIRVMMNGQIPLQDMVDMRKDEEENRHEQERRSIIDLTKLSEILKKKQEELLAAQKEDKDDARDEDFELYKERTERLKKEARVKRMISRNVRKVVKNRVAKVRSTYSTQRYYDCSNILQDVCPNDDSNQGLISRDIHFDSFEAEQKFIEKIPSYNGLYYTLYDLYTLKYTRKRKDYRVFSYGNTDFLLDHITSTDISTGELAEQLSAYCGENKVKKIIKERNKEDVDDFAVIGCLNLLSRFRYE